MSESRRQSELQPYRDAVKRFGPGFKATLWGTPEAQRLRFDVFLNMAAMKGCSIVDAGCGSGDFADHLMQRDVAFTHYLGIDALPEQIRAAERRGLDRCAFAVRDLLGDVDAFDLGELGAPDWVCMSGTLNTMDEATARALVCRAYDSAAQGVVFNFLSDRFHPRWAKQELGPARRFCTSEWVAWAMQCSTRVRFAQDYLDGHDATIMIQHDDA